MQFKTVLLWVCLVALLAGCRNKEPESGPDIAALQQELEKEKRIRAEYENANRSLTQMLERAEADERGDFEKWETERLKKRGLNDPGADLRKSLSEQTQFLPGKSDKGLEFRFDSEGARFLRPHYVWVSFDEGHYGGWMLLEYEVRDGEITWEKLWAEIE